MQTRRTRRQATARAAASQPPGSPASSAAAAPSATALLPKVRRHAPGMFIKPRNVDNVRGRLVAGSSSARVPSRLLARHVRRGPMHLLFRCFSRANPLATSSALPGALCYALTGVHKRCLNCSEERLYAPEASEPFAGSSGVQAAVGAAVADSEAEQLAGHWCGQGSKTPCKT